MFQTTNQMCIACTQYTPWHRTLYTLYPARRKFHTLARTFGAKTTLRVGTGTTYPDRICSKEQTWTEHLILGGPLVANNTWFAVSPLNSMGLPQTRVSILIALFIIMFPAVELLFSEYPVPIVQQANSSLIKKRYIISIFRWAMEFLYQLVNSFCDVRRPQWCSENSTITS